MNRIHRRVQTGRLVSRALDNTFTGTTHIIAIIHPQKPWRLMGQPKGKRYFVEFASLDGPNGFPGDTGRVVR